jgi:hypothetical protein
VILDLSNVTLHIKKTRGMSSGSYDFLSFRESYSFALEALVYRVSVYTYMT